nr:XRE family transcriptional regulator [Nocardioides flavescens]
MDLDLELADYAALQASTASVTAVANLADLPRSLVRARIALGLTQRELAERLGLREQQVQRYEASDYAGASVGRLQEVMTALDVTFDGEVGLPAAANNGAALRRGLRGIGLSSETLSRRFFGQGSDDAPTHGWMIAAARAARIFDLDIARAITGDIPPRTSLAAFRATRTANREALNGYAVFAEYLARLLLRVCTQEYRPLPSAAELRTRLGDDLVERPLESLTRVAWEHGVPVLPLRDRGAFHGACWRIEGRPVIGLKNTFRSPDRWAFLLAHELHHADNPSEGAVLEADLPVAEWREQPAERAADDFAAELLLGPTAEAMVRVAVQRAGGQAARLVDEVPAVAAAGNVSLGLFADHVAARTGQSGVNWWPTATQLHSGTEDAWLIVRNCLFDYVDLTRLDSLDRDILIDGIGL